MDMIEISNGFYQRDGFLLTMNFALQQESVTAVLGPSGAGKSTLLNVIAGFDQLQQGQVVLAGKAHNTSSPASRPVSFVFQDHNSFAHLTARDNVALGIAPNLKLSQAKWAEVDAALANVGIDRLALRLPGDMSGGERQRIALARVLVRQKPILLLDEAFSALGPALRIEMLALVKRIQSDRKLTVVMVTHSPEDALAITDQVMFVVDGEVGNPLPTKSFFRSKVPAIRNYLGNPQLPT